jgi:hypothetical protein
MTTGQEIKTSAPWRDFAMTSISQAKPADHAEVIAGRMMQERASRTPCIWYLEHNSPQCPFL